MRASFSSRPISNRSSVERTPLLARGPSRRKKRLPLLHGVLLVASVACVLFLLAGPLRAADPESEFRGRRLAEANCAHCHAIAMYDPSENADAPPFRRLGRLRPLESLRKEFAGDFFRRHPEMPDFEPTREQIDDIVDFIESIQR